MVRHHMLFGPDARDKILHGASALTDAVRVSLGPKSKCVLIGKKWGIPIVCNDGVTIAKNVELDDPDEDLGARMIREAAVRTGDAVGDGTTTATILAHSIYAEGIKNVGAGGSAIDLKRGLDKGLAAAVASLRAQARPVTSRREKVQVATVSAHNDPSIGELVADAIEKVGGDGVVSVEEAKGIETVLEVVEGLQFDRGFLSPYFVTDPERMECVLEDAQILLYEKKITSIQSIIPLLERVARGNRPLLLVAEDVEGEALATLVVNKLRGTLRCAAVKAPGFGERRRALLEDIAIVTGGRAITEDLGVPLDKVSDEDLGRARRVVITRDETTLIGGLGDKAAIHGRIEQLRRASKDSTSDYDREQLQQRLGKITGGVAVLRVGAPAEAELKSKKEAIEDAISATKAAIAEGIVPGAGLALLRAADALEPTIASSSGDVRTGIEILRHALDAPTRQIAANSEVTPGLVIEHMRGGSGSFGFDAATRTYVDLIEAGIIDPAKVLRVALENAVSVASVLLLTEATLTEEPEPAPGRPQMGGDLE